VLYSYLTSVECYVTSTCHSVPNSVAVRSSPVCRPPWQRCLCVVFNWLTLTTWLRQSVDWITWELYVCVAFQLSLTNHFNRSCWLIATTTTSSSSISSADWAIHINYSNAVYLNVNQGGTNHNCCTQRLLILHAQTHLKNMTTLHTKTRSVWPTLRVKIVRWRKWAWIGIFKSVESHSPRDAC